MLYPDGDVSRLFMLVISCITVMLMALVVIRKVLQLQVEIDQRRVYARKDDRVECRASIIKIMKDKWLFLSLLLEMLMILPHPLSFLQGWHYQV